MPSNTLRCVVEHTYFLKCVVETWMATVMDSEKKVTVTCSEDLQN